MNDTEREAFEAVMIREGYKVRRGGAELIYCDPCVYGGWIAWQAARASAPAALADSDHAERISRRAGDLLIAVDAALTTRKARASTPAAPERTAAEADDSGWRAGMVSAISEDRLVELEMQGREAFPFKAELKRLVAAYRAQSGLEHWQASSGSINALPEPVRKYIADIETMCDPAGLVRENAQLKDVARELEASNRLLRAAAPAPAEPVAWGCFYSDGYLDAALVGTKVDCEYWRDADDATNKWIVGPLYATPPAPEVRAGVQFAAEWLRNNYQDHPNITSLCDAMLAAAPQAKPAPAQAADARLTPELVEERLHSWRQRLMNRSGDRLALDDFMGQESIDDLIDFVCAPLSQQRERP